MEEIRSFGYICPHCGKAVLHQRSVFALSAAAARMECECGHEALEAETDGVKFRLWVPCGVCGGHHQAECGAPAAYRPVPRMLSFIWQHRSSRSRSVAAFRRSLPPHLAQVRSTAPRRTAMV